MKPLILLVEDDPNILKLLKITLEYNQYQVVMAENGKKGLKVLSELKNRFFYAILHYNKKYLFVVIKRIIFKIKKEKFHKNAPRI